MRYIHILATYHHCNSLVVNVHVAECFSLRGCLRRKKNSQTKKSPTIFLMNKFQNKRSVFDFYLLSVVFFALLSRMYTPPTTMVMSGAGANAIMQVGCVVALDAYLRKTGISQTGIYGHFTRLRGVSAGALVSALICIKLPLIQIMKVLADGVTGMLDCPVDIMDSIERRGLSRMQSFREMLQEHFKERNTFESLYLRTNLDLGVGVTNLLTRKFVMMTHRTHPDVSVVDAIMASISIPFLVEPVLVDGNLCADGGVVVNFPYPSHYWVKNDAHESFGIMVAGGPNNIEIEDLSNWALCVSLLTSVLSVPSEFSCKLVENNNPENVVRLFSRFNGISLTACMLESTQRTMTSLGMIFFWLKVGQISPKEVLRIFPILLDVLVATISMCYLLLGHKKEM